MIKKLPILLFICFISARLTASSAIGGEITYKYLGNSQYSFQIKIYRDCRTISLKTISVGWYAGKNNTMTCGNGGLPNFVRTSITSINYLCSRKKDPCDPQNSYGTGEGIERHIWEDTLDLSQPPFASALAGPGCTEFNVYAGFCCRSGAITTGGSGDDFHVTCSINIENLRACKIKGNNSAVRKVEMPMFACCNQPFYYNPGISDYPDYDSLSIKFAAPVSSLPSSGVGYSTPFSYRYPVSCYCPPNYSVNCTPQPNFSPPKGTYLDSFTGDFITTPVKCDEVTVFAFETTEYRRDTTGKMVEVGRTRQDLQLIVKDDCGYNKTPTITTNSWTVFAIAGDKTCQKFVISDPPFLPYQTAKDTISENFGGENPNATFTVSNDTISNIDTVTFCIQPSLADTASGLQHFYIQAMDNFCDRRSVASRGFVVKVLIPDSSWVTATPAGCNGIKLKAGLLRGQNNNAQYNWTVFDSASGKTVASGGGSSIAKDYLTPGTYGYILKAMSEPYGYHNTTGYFQIKYPLMTAQLSTNAVCKGSDALVTASIAYNRGSVHYRWSEDTTVNQPALTLKNRTGNTTVKLTATDSAGCVATALTSVEVLSLPAVSWKSSILPSLCQNSPALQIDSLIMQPSRAELCSNRFSITSKLTSAGTYPLLDSVNPCKYLYHPDAIPNYLLGGGKSQLDSVFLTYTDSAGCMGSAAARIQINSHPEVELIDYSICQNKGQLLMDSTTLKPKVKFGTRYDWYPVSVPSGVNPAVILKDYSNNGTDWRFQFGNKNESFYGGQYQFRLVVKDQITGCAGSDTNTITVKNEPVLSLTGSSPEFCEGAASYKLDGLFLANGNTPASGKTTYRITTLNGDTSSSKWKGIGFAGDFVTGSPKEGIYTIRCSHAPNGCPESIDASFRIHPIPNSRFKSTPDSIASVTLPIFQFDNLSTITSGNMNFFWDFDHPNLVLTSSASSPQVQYPMKDSTYTVRLTATSDQGCESHFEKVVQVGKGKYNSVYQFILNQLNTGNDFTLRGVPFDNLEVRVYETTGKLIVRRTQNEPVNLPAGIYYYEVSLSQNGETLHFSGKKLVQNQ